MAKHLSLGPTDGYAPLWLYLERRHAHADPVAELNAAARNIKSSSDWPAPLLRIFQGALGEDVLDAKIAATPDLEQNVRCEAAFYLGDKDLLDGRIERAKQRLRQAVETCTDEYGELSAAKSLLRGL